MSVMFESIWELDGLSYIDQRSDQANNPKITYHFTVIDNKLYECWKSPSGRMSIARSEALHAINWFFESGVYKVVPGSQRKKINLARLAVLARDIYCLGHYDAKKSPAGNMTLDEIKELLRDTLINKGGDENV